MYVKQTEIAGKSVLDGAGNTLGTVKEVAFNLGGELALVVATKGGEITVPFGSVQAVGEFILLKVGAASSEVHPVRATPTRAGCPRCGKTLKAGGRFCGSCGAAVTEA